MPELPEVETICRHLRDGTVDSPPLAGQQIVGVRLAWLRHVVEPSPASLRQRIRGQMVREVNRRGKFILLSLDRDTLIVHLMMSGDLFLAPAGIPRSPHDHTIFRLASGWQLRFRDPRKFGRVFLVADRETVLERLGPEPLSEGFQVKQLELILARHKRALKPLLLDQAAIAGLGNIYTDEALHRARLHPLRGSQTLGPSEIRALWKGIRSALRDGLRHNGASIDWVYRGGNFQNHFRVYGQDGEPCPVCGTTIVRSVIGQRSTFTCPNCQPWGKN
ncbi:MAG: DNA-formamidopyrimidine glycosylase [Anaerolineales bacterium]